MKRLNVAKNSVKNTVFGLLLQVITMFGGFITKTLIIYKLGIEFVGLDGLFASILTFLNMAELGFSTAIVYKLYKPIAENDTLRVNALLKYYRKIYRCIGLIVLVAGLSLIPFLQNLVDVNRVPQNINLYVIYLICLSGTVVTYWLFSYKVSLFNANQRNDVVSKIHSSIIVFQYLIQIVFLCLFKNFYLYLAINLISNIVKNITVHIYSKKYYPQYKCEGEVEKEVRVDIRRRIEALIYNKIGITIINGSDNIVISKFLGLVTLGIYVSYYYIFNMAHIIFNVIRDAVTAGIGNKIITESVDDNLKTFNQLYFLYAWMTGFFAICLVCLYEPFMSLWVGAEKTQSPWFSLLMGLYFYFWIIRFVVLIFKNAQGLWWEDRFRPFCEGVLNLILNLLMVKTWGLYGIVASTIIAMVVISVPWETYVLFSKYFHSSMKAYFLNMIKWILITVIVGILTYLLCVCIPLSGWFSFIIKAVICCIIPNLCFYLIFRKSMYFEYFKSFTLRLVNMFK